MRKEGKRTLYVSIMLPNLALRLHNIQEGCVVFSKTLRRYLTNKNKTKLCHFLVRGFCERRSTSVVLRLYTYTQAREFFLLFFGLHSTQSPVVQWIKCRITNLIMTSLSLLWSTSIFYLIFYLFVCQGLKLFYVFFYKNYFMHWSILCQPPLLKHYVSEYFKV